MQLAPYGALVRFAPLVGALVCFAPLVGADVLTVDAGGRGDFTELQPAIDAALPGDVVLVRAGTYAPAVVSFGGLVVAAEPGAAPIVLGGLEVRDTAPGQTTVLAGLDLRGVNAGRPGQREGLVVRDCAGAVRVAEVTSSGAAGLDYAPPEFGGEGAWITGSPDVVFSACALRGGAGGESFSGGDANRGGSALFARVSDVALFDCGSTAGDGGPGDFLGCDIGGAAGHGVELVDSFVFVAGGRLLGGDGGGDGFLGCEPGGHGALVTGADSELWTHGALLEGGAGACGHPPGQPSLAVDGAVLHPSGAVARTLAFAPLAPAASALPIRVEGAPGEAVLMVASDTTQWIAGVLFDGVLTVPPPWLTAPIPLGALAGAGDLELELQLPGLPPGTGAFELHLQAVHAGPNGAALGAPAPLVLLEGR